MNLNIPHLTYKQEIPYLNVFENPWQNIVKNILIRDPNLENLSIEAFGFIGDHGIANTQFSYKKPQYTASMFILASEKKLLPNTVKHSIHDISGERYFTVLDNVESNKIGRIKNFLSENAIEPQRLLNAIAIGKTIVKNAKSPYIYLFDIGAGNDIAGESLLKNLYHLNAEFSRAKQLEEFTQKFNLINITNEHPFSYLERFGGYETAVILGAIFQSVENGKYLFLDGWSAIAAMAIGIKLFPDIQAFLQIIARPKSAIYHELMQHLNLLPLFLHQAPNERAFYAEPTQNIIAQLANDLRSHITQ